MKKEYKYRMVIGVAILLVAIALQIFWNSIHPSVISTLITVGIVLIGTGVIRHMKFKEGPEKDERTKKIGAFALGYSWVATLVLVGVLILLHEFNILRMSAMQALGLTMFVMITVALFFQLYLKRKGDVE